MTFVFGASNIRAYNYNITMESAFNMKQIAGNIIPAVSSTNGLIGAVEVSESVKILVKQTSELKAVSYSAKGGSDITSSKLINER